jgi:hypothetical protein
MSARRPCVIVPEARYIMFGPGVRTVIRQTAGTARTQRNEQVSQVGRGTSAFRLQRTRAESGVVHLNQAPEPCSLPSCLIMTERPALDRSVACYSGLSVQRFGSRSTGLQRAARIPIIRVAPAPDLRSKADRSRVVGLTPRRVLATTFE